MIKGHGSKRLYESELVWREYEITDIGDKFKYMQEQV